MYITCKLPWLHNLLITWTILSVQTLDITGSAVVWICWVLCDVYVCVFLFVVHCQWICEILVLWLLSNHTCCQARILGVKSVQMSQCGFDIPKVYNGTSLPPSPFTNSAGSHSSPSLSILSTASCEPQRRRSVQDLPGIGTESSQVRNSQTLESGRGFVSLIHWYIHSYLTFWFVGSKNYCFLACSSLLDIQQPSASCWWASG